MKTFEERKKCIMAICAENEELKQFETQIESIIKEEKLNDIILQIQQMNIENIDNIIRQIMKCSNLYSEDKPYR